MHKSLIALAALACLGAGTAQADTLDFEAFAPGDLGSTVLVMPNATVSGFGETLYNLSDYFGIGSGGSICSLAAGFTCQADLQVDFDGAVSGLTLQTYGYNSGDFVAISAYAGATLLGTINVASDTLVDFSAFSGVTRLTMDDSSTGAGYAYGSFNFTPAIPEPGTWLLLLAGLGAIGATARRRRAD